MSNYSTTGPDKDQTLEKVSLLDRKLSYFTKFWR